MSNGYRTQLKIHGLEPGEIPLEGEPIWDPTGRRLGFWDFNHSQIGWFRIPQYGDNETYIPQHKWEGSSLSFQNADGSWGSSVNLTGSTIDSITLARNINGSYSFTFNVDIEGNITPHTVTTLPLEDRFIGTWNAELNYPHITSSVGINGTYYIVDVPGTVNIDGMSSWYIGDKIAFENDKWVRVPLISPVSSVAGKTGDVTLAISDISGLAVALTKRNVTALDPGSQEFILEDAGKIIKAAAQTITVPLHATTEFPIGTEIKVFVASGTVVIDAESPTVTLLASGVAGSTNAWELAAETIVIISKVDTDTWIISGAGITSH